MTTDEHEGARSKFFADRANRKTVNEKDGKDKRESWTNGRERRAFGGDDDSRQEGRSARREKDHVGERRNGFGEKTDGRWTERRQNGDRQGGWRERDRDRDRKDRDWDRGGHAEKNPEWMDDPALDGAEDDLRSMGMPRNQEQFQRWKEAMSGKSARPSGDMSVQPEAQITVKEVKPVERAAHIKLEGIVDRPFGGLTDSRSSDAAASSASNASKAAPVKSKGSRFASMFKESQSREEPPPSASNVQKIANTIANGSAEDEAGFKRILEMLGGTGSSLASPLETPSSPPTKSTANGPKQKSRFTGFFDQPQKSPEQALSPPTERRQIFMDDTSQNSRGVINNFSLGRTTISSDQAKVQESEPKGRGIASSEDPSSRMDDRKDQQSSSGRMNDIFLKQPPSRETATPDLNIQNLLASQRAHRSQQGQDKNSEFLLNLLQTKSSSRPSSQQAGPDNNFALWLDQPSTLSEPHAPKPRVPAQSALSEDQLMRANSIDSAKHHQQVADGERIQRRESQRAPPSGIYDAQTLFMQQQQQQAGQRRNVTEPQHYPSQAAARRMSGQQGIPHMTMPPLPPQYHGPPSFYQRPDAGQVPPPGFRQHMRAVPPGFHNTLDTPHLPHMQREDMHSFTGTGPQSIPGSSGAMSASPQVPPGFFGGPNGVPPGFFAPGPPEGLPPALRTRGGGHGHEIGNVRR